MTEKRGVSQTENEGLAQISVYLPNDLLARLRKEAKKERRSLSAQVVLLLECYENEQTPDAAQRLRTALDSEVV